MPVINIDDDEPELMIAKKSSASLDQKERKELGITYQCGQCSSKVKIFGKETIMCKECGYRVLYKTRINKRIEYMAR